MANASNAFEVILLDHIFMQSSFTMPTNLFVALSKNTIGNDQDSFTEADYSNYARETTTTGTWDVTSVSNVGTSKNTNAITFAQCGATTTNVIWGFGIYSALAAGTQYVWGNLQSSLSVTQNVAPEFAAGNLSITCA